MSWHQDRLKHEPNPFRDWKVVLLAATMSFILILIMQGYIYFYYIYTEPKLAVLSGPDTIHETIELPKLEKVIKLISDRQIEFEVLSAKRPFVADPSR